MSEPAAARPAAPDPGGPGTPRLSWIQRLQSALFDRRGLILGLFAALTLLLGWQASQLRVDAGFEKQLPEGHPYIDTFLAYQQQFGGANRVIVALAVRQGDIFTPAFMDTLRRATDDVFFIPGVDRARVSSLFTPNVRFIEVVEDGFAGGNVIPADFAGTPDDLARVRQNVLKSGQVGRLVAEDFTAAIVSAELVERDPATGARLDYLQVAHQLEALRAKYSQDGVEVHIIGFAKAMGDIADGAGDVVGFFAIAIAVTALLVLAYGRSLLMTLVLLGVSLTTVAWQLGLLVILGYGIDPLSILVPFLVFAIAISHGVQNVGTVTQEIGRGADAFTAAGISFSRLLVPGAAALLADAVGFLTISAIPIRMIQELAVSAALGMVVIILTHLVVLPLVLSALPLGERYRARVEGQVDRFDRLWRLCAVFASPRGAIPAVVAALALFVWAAEAQRHMVIGDAEAGVPELWPDSRYNRDAAFVASHFAIGVDIIQVIAEGPANGCIDHRVISSLDDFEWRLRNVPGVHATVSMASTMKGVNAGWNEGNPKWRVLPRNSQVLVRTATPIETATGLLNADCSAMPVVVFMDDHKAETIARLVAAVEDYGRSDPDAPLTFRLATGNVGVMAATNQAVTRAEKPMLIYVYLTVLAFCLLTFRSLVGTVATVLPLVLVSVLCNALMAELGIGLKISTLPAAALGVGIGVDYGLYIFNRLQAYLQNGLAFADAHYRTLQETGSSVLLTGLTLAVGVATWSFSSLKFQADMGSLLTFIFLANMIGAIILLPAVAALLYRLFPALFVGEVRRARSNPFSH